MRYQNTEFNANNKVGTCYYRGKTWICELQTAIKQKLSLRKKLNLSRFWPFSTVYEAQNWFSETSKTLSSKFHLTDKKLRSRTWAKTGLRKMKQGNLVIVFSCWKFCGLLLELLSLRSPEDPNLTVVLAPYVCIEMINLPKFIKQTLFFRSMMQK